MSAVFGEGHIRDQAAANVSDGLVSVVFHLRGDGDAESTIRQLVALASSGTLNANEPFDASGVDNLKLVDRRSDHYAQTVGATTISYGAAGVVDVAVSFWRAPPALSLEVAVPAFGVPTFITTSHGPTAVTTYPDTTAIWLADGMVVSVTGARSVEEAAQLADEVEPMDNDQWQALLEQFSGS